MYIRVSLSVFFITRYCKAERMLTRFQKTTVKPPSRRAAGRKARAWKFAGEFFVRRAFQKDKSAFAKWIREELVALGPTYTKLGQAASTRTDVLDSVFTQELARLQDDVPLEDLDVMSVIDPSKFEYVDHTPIASASIGQVYRARLADDGTEVVVKVRRSGILDRMREDTDTLRNILTFVEFCGIDTGTGSSFILEETIDNLLLEADYEHETRNAAAFYQNFKSVPYVRAPKVFPKLSSMDAIVLEYIEGTKLDDLPENVNPRQIAKGLISSYVLMCFDHGFFHADPHPGNVVFSPVDEALVFYDFGVVVSIDERMREGMWKILSCAVQRDTKALVRALVELGIIVPTTTDTIDVELFFEKILVYLEKVDVSELKSDLLRDETMLELAESKPFVLPSFIIYLCRAFTMVEGQLKRLDPEFSYYKYLEPIMMKKIQENADLNLKETLVNAARLPTTVNNIRDAVLNLEKQRAAVRRSLKKTRREIRSAQYSTFCAMLSLEMENTYLSAFFGIMAIYWLVTSRKNR